jgi:hypothetical protein
VTTRAPPAPAAPTTAADTLPVTAIVTALGAVLGVFVLWGVYVLKNRRVLRHFAKRYEHSMHKLVPPLTIGTAVLSLVVSVKGFKLADTDTGLSPLANWPFWAAIFGIVTSALSLAYGLYCMCTVWRTIRAGRGKLDAMPGFVRDWYCREHYSSLRDRDSAAEFVTDALMESDFLEQMQRDSARTDQRRQVAAAVELLDVDPDAVTWHEERAFAAGGFSTVWRVMYCGEVVAAKVVTRPGAQSIRKAEAWLHGVKKEAAILHRLSACENIVNVLGIFERADGAVVLMEYASGGTLRDYLHGIRLDDASTFTGTGTGTGKSASTSSRATASTSSIAAVGDPLPPLEQAEQLSILIDVSRAMLFCYTQDPPVQHRWFSVCVCVFACVFPALTQLPAGT